MSAPAAVMRKRHHAPAATLAAIVRAVRLGLLPLRAVTPMRLADWAARKFRLTADSSHQVGQWESWPIQVGIFDAFSNDDIRQVDVQKAKRVGYSKGLTAFIGYNAEHRKRKQALWQPTDDDRDSFVKSEVEPMIEEVPAVKAACRSAKGAADTIKFKQFRGTVAHFLGGKAARAYRRITVAVAMLDELDGFDQQIEKSSDPVTLARGRLEGAPFPKLICGSTPRIKGLSHIERQVGEADARLRFHIVCPHCDVDHPLLWGSEEARHGFKWESGQPATVRHVCPHCHGSITQADYLRDYVGRDAAGRIVWTKGAWVCESTGVRYGPDRTWRDASGQPIRPPAHVAFKVWTAYSPQREWWDIVDEFLKARAAQKAGDDGPMQGWTNETKGETWEIIGERVEDHVLQKRAEPYPLCTAPVGVLKITAGVDLQGNRWEIGVWGWGRGLESWPIDHHVIEGNPVVDADWEQVAQYLRRRYLQAWHGGTLGIEAISIDANFHTQAVLNFVRIAQTRFRIHAVRGDQDTARPIKGTATPQEVTWRGQRFRNGVKLWTIGVHAAKDLLHGQLAIAAPGPGYVHFSDQLPREWFEQLTAEQKIQVRGPTGDIFRWVKRRPRNEVLDTRNYALHSAYMLGMHSYTDRQWTELEAAVQPPPDLFTPAPPVAKPAERQVERLPVAAGELPALPPARSQSPQRPSTRDW